MDTYQVVGECFHVTVNTAGGRVNQLLYRNAILPADTSAERIRHGLSLNLIAKVGGVVAPAAPVEEGEGGAGDGTVVDPDAAAVGTESDAARAEAKAKLPADGSAPAKNAAAAVWVEYAVAKGYDYEACKTETREALIALVTSAA